MIDGMRLLMIGTPSTYSLSMDFTVLGFISLLMVLIGGSLYKRIIL